MTISAKIQSLLIATLLFLIQQSKQFVFDISLIDDRCFLEDWSEQSRSLISYTVYGLESADENDKSAVLGNIQFRVFFEDTKEVTFIDNLKKTTGKVSVPVSKSGHHRLCVQFYGGYWVDKFKLTMAMKVITETSPEPNLVSGITKEHVKTVHDSVLEVLNQGKKILETQQTEIALEDEDAQKIMTTHHNFIYFTLLQIVVVVLLFFFQIYSIKKLISNNDGLFSG